LNFHGSSLELPRLNLLNIFGLSQISKIFEFREV